jgi:hypothetical protein
MVIKAITLLILRDITRRIRLLRYIYLLIYLTYSNLLILGALGRLKRHMVKK